MKTTEFDLSHGPIDTTLTKGRVTLTIDEYADPSVTVDGGEQVRYEWDGDCGVAVVEWVPYVGEVGEPVDAGVTYGPVTTTMYEIINFPERGHSDGETRKRGIFEATVANVGGGMEIDVDARLLDPDDESEIVAVSEPVEAANGGYDIMVTADLTEADKQRHEERNHE